MGLCGKFGDLSDLCGLGGMGDLIYLGGLGGLVVPCLLNSVFQSSSPGSYDQHLLWETSVNFIIYFGKHMPKFEKFYIYPRNSIIIVLPTNFIDRSLALFWSPGLRHTNIVIRLSQLIGAGGERETPFMVCA